MNKGVMKVTQEKEAKLKQVIKDVICLKMGQAIQLYANNQPLKPEKMAEEGYKWIRKAIVDCEKN